MLSNTLRLNFCYLKIIHILHARYHPNIIWYILENKQNKKCVCFREIIRLIIMKMEMKMKKKSHRYGMSRPRSRHGHIYSKYKKCLSKMMLICIKKHLSNIWSSIYEKVKQHWDWVGKKSVAYKKKFVFFFAISESWPHQLKINSQLWIWKSK